MGSYICFKVTSNVCKNLVLVFGWASWLSESRIKVVFTGLGSLNGVSQQVLYCYSSNQVHVSIVSSLEGI